MNETKIELHTAYGSAPLLCYEHEKGGEKLRPAMLVLPGGGYKGCSTPIEGIPIAMEFYRREYNAYVLEYSCDPARFPTQLVQAATAMDTIRRRAEICNTDSSSVFAVGFSAGGHLCGTLANCPSDFAPVKGLNFSPDGIVLCYAVIGGRPTHIWSFESLLGGDGVPRGETAWLDLHTSVRKENPPAFLWSTAEDRDVPAVNSMRYAAACGEKGVPYELHVFPRGPHAMSLATERLWGAEKNKIDAEVARWPMLADNFLRRAVVAKSKRK